MWIQVGHRVTTPPTWLAYLLNKGTVIHQAPPPEYFEPCTPISTEVHTLDLTT